MLAATNYVRNWHTKLRELLRCQAVKALIHRRAQFEGDAWQNIEPMQLIVEDVRQTLISLPWRRDTFAVFDVNTLRKCGQSLGKVAFGVDVLHYSLFVIL